VLGFARKYVRIVDATNYRIGRVMMYGIFVMVGILLWSSISKVAFLPSRWTLEVAQFAMVAYYILGGPYSIQLGANVRMDLFYGEWTDRRKAQIDSLTVLFLLAYLGVLLYGAIDSTAFSLGKPYNMEPFVFFKNLFVGFITGGFDGASEVIGRLERSATAWRPYLWPIKVTMIIGIFLMLLQAISELIKDIAKIKGVAL
jgi:TRAP-type mannitol/chloroaromatic compound transport system permease small subunit